MTRRRKTHVPHPHTIRRHRALAECDAIERELAARHDEYADGARETVRRIRAALDRQPAEVVHARPDDSGRTPCCDRPPATPPACIRVTDDPAAVTCTGPATEGNAP